METSEALGGAWSSAKEPSEVTIHEIEELTREIFELRARKDAMEEEAKKVGKSLASCQGKLVAYLNEFGKSKWEIGGLGTVSVTKRLSVRNPSTPEKREAFFNYLKEKGVFEDLITVHSNTLNSFYKEELRIQEESGNGNWQMPGVDPHTVSETLAIRRIKK